MKTIPGLGGEADIIKSISLLPGVRSEGDGGGGFEVRGGSAYQNLIQLDGISLYNPSHVMGIFSTFNGDALGAATLYKGPFPAMFGGASSSVLDTHLSPGDMERWGGSFTVGILASKIKVEGPLVSDRLSLAVAARRSYVDAFLKMVPKYRSTVMNFYDVSARMRWLPSQGNIIDASFFIGHDNMAIAKLMGLYWGNTGASVNWVSRPNDRFSSTLTAALTHFDPKMSMDLMADSQTMLTYIHDYSLNEKVTYRLGDNHNLELGVRSKLLKVKSAEWIANAATEREIRSLWENSFWIDYNGMLGNHINLNLGLRGVMSDVITSPHFHDFASLNDTFSQFEGKKYFSLEPRVNVKYSFNDFHNIKLGYGITTQNLHAIRSSTTSFPFDRYALTSAYVRPEKAMHYGAGYSGMTSGGGYDWSAEVFFRNISNVYDFKDGKSAFSNIALEDLILGGKGKSYGLELMLRKNAGPLTGWISYTLSRTETKIPGINDDRWYDATNDRRHDFAVTAIYTFNSRWSLSGSWIFMSGQPLTAPDVKYEVAGKTCYYYSQRNSYMTPPVHRLDLGATYTHKGRKFTYEWTFGVYNAYCRYNPYIVHFEDDPSSPSGTRAVQQSMYGLVPSVSYTLKL
ncbi:MAG: TonB-dependent receptor plug domain-containing protein [Muribaculaceae bacterium]|nr:TonB-dependent receptor plug domain-containing protein [Muribaculaceae bacterium]